MKGDKKHACISHAKLTTLVRIGKIVVFSLPLFQYCPSTLGSVNSKFNQQLLVTVS